MTVFISYARANQAAAELLHADVERCHREVWVDRELTGGQSWWRAILQHIRECDVFVVALSPEWINSKACNLELAYALALGRPVLPVMVSKVDPRLAPPEIADAQIIGYLQRGAETTFALMDALNTLPAAAPPLPSPLPPEPAAPISYLHNIVIMLNAPALTPANQYELWRQLQAALNEAQQDERGDLLELVRRLRKRHDLTPPLGLEIDAVLGPATPPGEQTWPPPYAPVPDAPTDLLPPPPPPARSRRRLVLAAVSAAVVLLALSIWGVVAMAGEPSDSGGVQPTTTTSSTTETTTPPDPTTTTNTRRITTTTAPRPSTFTMPDLVGFTPDRAKSGLKALGWQGSLNVSQVAVTDSGQDGLIMSQTPLAGRKVGTRDPVTVKVGRFDGPSPPVITTTTQPVIR